MKRSKSPQSNLHNISTSPQKSFRFIKLRSPLDRLWAAPLKLHTNADYGRPPFGENAYLTARSNLFDGTPQKLSAAQSRDRDSVGRTRASLCRSALVSSRLEPFEKIDVKLRNRLSLSG
jgi:hypothetical protein